MPGTTPVYGFPYPEPTDLVADYPALGQDLAEDIETILPTVPGLQRINTQTISAVSTVSVNNCFSATYENYRIVVRLTHSASNDTLFRLRAAGTDNTTNNYIHQRLNASGASTFPNRATTTYGPILEGANTNVWAVLDISNPFTAAITQWYSYGVGAVTATLENKTLAGVHNVASSFDGITIYAGAGTFTGSFTIYGYKNS